MPHDVASDLGLHCLPITLYKFPGKNGVNDQLLREFVSSCEQFRPEMQSDHGLHCLLRHFVCIVKNEDSTCK